MSESSMQHYRDQVVAVAARQTKTQFYVDVRDAGRVGLLLGPYATHDEAKANVERARKLAEAGDRWAHFYAFGTCGIKDGITRRTVFGR